MKDSDSPTVVHAFATLVATDATQPVMTFYDDATGERTELSGATLANWVAKTANLLVDGCGVGPSGLASVRLPAHWQTAAVLLGCWSARLAVDLGPGPGPGADVAFVTADAAGTVSADETYALALAPLGMPFRPGPPPGTLDYVVEVRTHGDHFGGPPPDPSAPALADGTSHRDLADAAAALGVVAGSRVLIDGDSHTDPVAWLVAPLTAGTSVVLCRHLGPGDRAARLAALAAAEHATPFTPPPRSRA